MAWSHWSLPWSSENAFRNAPGLIGPGHADDGMVKSQGFGITVQLDVIAEAIEKSGSIRVTLNSSYTPSSENCGAQLPVQPASILFAPTVTAFVS